MLKLHGSIDEVYLVLRRKDEEALPVLAYAARVGEINEFVFVRVTRREQYQDEISRARERLIGILGHDLRVPLTSIALASETLLRYENVSAEGQEMVVAILASARRAARMTTDLLDFARARFAGGIPIQRQPMDLRVVAEKVIAELRTIHPAHSIELRVEGDCQGSWDPDRAAQVVANLTTNAINHGGGSPIAITISGGADAVVLEVQNASSAPVIAEIFSPFRQGPGSTGLGLGLFIVQQVMQAHGGTVSATAVDGEFRARTAWPR